MMLLVVNRNAGNGKGVGIWRSVEDCLWGYDIPYDMPFRGRLPLFYPSFGLRTTHYFRVSIQA